jgi:ATP-dependent helicase/nuclease subunit A
MSGRIWTKEQLQAINAPAVGEKPVLVSAAAGSGKTAVLVERVVRLLSDGSVNADSIVLVTFTKKAAAEMKERLVRELRALSETPFIAKQLIRLEEAQITTINAFCLKLLRENSGFVSLEPGFRVGDDEELRLLSRQAMNRALEEFYGGDEAEIARTVAFFGGGGRSGDSGLQQAVLDLYLFTRNLPDADKWADEQLALYSDADRYYDTVVPQYNKLIEASIAEAVALINISLNAAEKDTTIEFLRSDLAFFESGGEFVRMNIHRGEREETKALIRENRAVVKKLAEGVELSRVLVSDFKNAVKKLHPIIQVLVRVERAYEQLFIKIKHMNKIVDFSDCEHLCLKLLRNEQIRRRLSANYELIIVDEFQDSNFLQYELFKLLDNGRNRLFMVGDIRQSIYGFRGADCAVFDEVSRDSAYEVKRLSMNFRSSNQVIAGVNAIFPEWERLQPGLGVDENGLETELVMLDEGADSVAAEAEYTAQRILQMIEENGFAPGDFAVLTSAGEKNFKVYEKVFSGWGIPCVSGGAGGYLKTEEIGLALDLLMVISNPYNDLSLFNIMMSPLFGFTAQEMAQIRADNRKMPLYSAVLRDTGGKTAGFLARIEGWRKLADVCSAAELIAVISADKGFEPLVSDGYKRANMQLLAYYAEKFTQTNTDSSLAAFLAYIKDLNSLGVDVKQANVNAKSAGAVRLMTIHGAKGLEFPVVFVGRANTQFNFRGENTALVRFDKRAGIVADWFCEQSLCRFRTLVSDFEKRLNRQATIAEEMRKLYVGATRAARKLVFTGFGKIRKDSYAEKISGGLPISGNLTPVLCRFDWDLTGETPVVHIGEKYEQPVGEYTRKPLAAIPRKMTATQVGVHNSTQYEQNHDEVTLFPRNPSFYGERRLTGKKRGDAYHKVMAGEKLTEFERSAVNMADIERFWVSSLGKRATASNKLEREYKLYTEVKLSDLGLSFAGEGVWGETPFIQGIADMFFYEDDGIVLVDYKTNRNTTAERLIHDYRGQLSIYKKAIEEMTGVNVKECWLYSFEIGEIFCDI